jgi:hypothetical protein
VEVASVSVDAKMQEVDYWKPDSYCGTNIYFPWIPLHYISGRADKNGFPCGGGVEYLHRSPASRRRRQKGSLESERVKYGLESHGTRTRE